MDKIQEYIEANYPNIEPCCNCEYWRYMTSGGQSGYFKGMNKYFVGKKRFSYARQTPDVCCHYGTDNDEPKPDGALHTDGTCDCFKARDYSYRKPHSKYQIKLRG